MKKQTNPPFGKKTQINITREKYEFIAHLIDQDRAGKFATALSKMLYLALKTQLKKRAVDQDFGDQLKECIHLLYFLNQVTQAPQLEA